MKKKTRIIEYLIASFVFILFLLLVNRYILNNTEYGAGALMEGQVKRIINIVDNKIGKCDDGEIRINIEGGYVCRIDNIEEDDYSHIFDTYPISANGREVVYDFLNRGDIEIANLMLENIYDITRYNPITIKNIEWDEDPYDEKYWKFLFYSLRPTRHLLYTWIETGDNKYMEKLVSMLESYTDIGLDKEETWSDYHAVAFRAMVLNNSWWKLREENALSYSTNAKILKAISQHGEFLLSPEHYEEGHNHGINEAVALLTISVNFPDLPGAEQWESVAKKRLSDSLSNLIDRDGALIENSPYYHFYVLEKYSQIYSFTKDHNILISEDFEGKINSMIDYATYILQPNLEIPLIGASLKDEIKLSGEMEKLASNNPSLMYVLSRGEKGLVPNITSKYFEYSGQTILRSNWSKGEEFKNQPYLFFDVGSYRTLHSDLDALNFTLFANGMDLIVDPGLYSYEANKYSSYFDGTIGHNTVMVDDSDQLIGSAYPSPIVEENGYSYQAANHNLYPGVTHYRTVALLEDNLVLIMDKLVSKDKHNYKQIFHIAPELEIELNDLSIIAKDKSGNTAMRIHQLSKNNISTNVDIGNDEEINGWCSNEYEKLIPCYAVSYEQESEQAVFVTVIEIKDINDNFESSINKDNILNITKGDDKYLISIDYPDSLSDFEIQKFENNNIIKENNCKLLFDKKQIIWDINCEGDKLSQITITEKNGNLFFTSNNHHQNYTLDISGFEKYYSVDSKTVTDIPYLGDDKFRLYEQEDYVPILGYHHVLSDTEIINNPTSEIHLSEFKEQIEYFTNVMGCRWLTFSDLMENYVLKEKKAPRNSCVINFDDGRTNNYYNALPVLDKYGVVATFYIIPGRLEGSRYMSWAQVDELYKKGHEIGSHTVNSGGLISAGWNHDELKYQIEESKKLLVDHGYKGIKTFAYPLGEWNDDIVRVVKNSGYIAARDTSKDNSWMDKRFQTASMDDESIWHAPYYKPENNSLEELGNILNYNTWWQFEEGFEINKDIDNDIVIRSSINPTDSSYAIVSLSDKEDKITNKFVVSKKASYTIEVFGSTGNIDGDNKYSNLDNIRVYIDGNLHQIEKGGLNDCVLLGDWYYCNYYLYTSLNEGAHTISIEALSHNIKLDKFRVFRTVKAQTAYDIVIITNDKNNQYAEITREEIKHIGLDISKNNERNINRQIINILLILIICCSFFVMLFYIIFFKIKKKYD
jgi:peptidoglycan/xylan/chitin deacetylase (PgdA/CDA1 family)